MNLIQMTQKFQSPEEQAYYIDQHTATQIIQYTGDNKEKRAIGCMFGSYIGDNIGTYTEFNKNVTEEQAMQALNCQGGGPHKVIAGQGTDDSELATSLGYALLASNKQEKQTINLDQIAKFYTIWLKSSPFDYGKTISEPFQAFVSDPEVNYSLTSQRAGEKQLAQAAIFIAKNNSQSESDGGCMRISPLIVFLSKLTNQEEIKKAIFSEQQLTHTNIVAQYCSYIYARVCINLIQNGSAEKAFQDIKNYIENYLNIGVIQQWWREHVLTEKFTNPTIQEVWIKHQLVQTLIYLKRIAEGNEEINSDLMIKIFKNIILMGGDTDTNCAIVGGMIGALLGIDRTPRQYQRAIINCDLQNLQQQISQPRPPIYNPRACFYLSHELYKIAPIDKVYVIGDGTKPLEQFAPYYTF